MTKLDFIAELGDKLSGLPADEIEERLNFYCEMIDDYIEDGLSEEEAVARIGRTDEIVDQIIADVPFAKIAKEKIKAKRRMRAWEIVLLAVGSPLWIVLLAALFVIVLSVYVVLWSVVVCVYAVFASLVGAAIGGAILSVVSFMDGNVLSGVFMSGAFLSLAGLSALCFFGANQTAKGMVFLSKKILLGIKYCFVERREK